MLDVSDGVLDGMLDGMLDVLDGLLDVMLDEMLDVLDGMWDGVLVGVLNVVLQMLGSGGGVACVRCVVSVCVRVDCVCSVGWNVGCVGCCWVAIYSRVCRGNWYVLCRCGVSGK